jgi:hypothetical protein
VDVPSPGQDELTAARLFDAGSRAIAEEWRLRIKADEKARPWLQKVAYAFISKVIDHGFQALFEQRLSSFERGTRGLEVSSNPFQRGLLAMFAHDKNRLLDEDTRQYLAPRLSYAYRNFVPAEFVNGFLKDVWGTGGGRRFKDNDIEPDLLEWVVIHLADHERPQVRGTYSPDIIQQARAVRAVLEPLREVEAAKRRRNRARASQPDP